MTFDGIIFDFNGVLLWDTPLHDRSWNQFAESVRGTPFTPHELTTLVHGRPGPDTLAYLFGRPLPPTEADHHIEQKEIIYRQMCLALGDDFQLSPGAVALLDWLVARDIPHAIATSSGKGNVDFFVRHLDLGRWFPPARIIYDDGSMAGKPAPDIYLRAAAVLNIPPARCVVVEDSLSGMEAAVAAGTGHVVALADHTPPLPGIDRVIANLGELPRSLFRQS